MKILKQIQQGDVWIEKVENFIGMEYGAQRWDMKRVDVGMDITIKNQLGEAEGHTEFILAAGEATGHHHRLKVNADGDTIVSDRPIKVDMDKGIFELIEKAILVHEEHMPIELDPGLYRFGIINEYDYEAKQDRRVWD